MKPVQILRQSSKGRLVYDRDPDSNKLKEFLEKCSSPPSLTCSHKEQSGSQSSPIGQLSSDNSPSTRDRNSSPVSPGLRGSSRSPIKSPLNDIRVVHVIVNDDKEEKRDKSKDERLVLKRSHALSPEYGRKEVAIKEYEALWETKAKEKALARQQLFEDNSRRLIEEASKGLLNLELETDNRTQSDYEHTVRQHRTGAAEVLRCSQKLKDDHRQHAQMLESKLHEAQRRRVQLQQEAEQREIDAQGRKDDLIAIHSNINMVKEKLTTLYSSCQYKHHLGEPTLKTIDLVDHIATSAEALMSQYRLQEVTTRHIQQLTQLLDRARNALDFLTQQIDEANKLGKEEDAKAAKILKQKTEAEAEEAAAKKQQEQIAILKAEELKSKEVLCVTVEAFDEYSKLRNQLKQVEQTIQIFINDANYKKYRFDLQKAINTPINAISPVNGANLRDNLQKLCLLLRGNQVEIIGKRVSVNDHPQSIAFCKNLIAKMIVKKGAEQVSSKHESAFAIAAVAVGLMCEFPDVGQLLIAHFHAVCPYTIPYYIPQETGQSTEEHHQVLGYKVKDGEVEKQDEFLKRMSGIMRLFAAILVSSPHRGNSHPHGIEEGWKWLCQVMNIDPHPDITATMIYDFLQVTGNALSRVYNKQFLKLLHILVTEFVPKLRAVAAADGPISRLESFLQMTLRNRGQIAVPDGFLQPNFWFS